MNAKRIKIESAISLMDSIIEEAGENRPYLEKENHPVAWAMRAKVILKEVNDEISHEYILEQLNATEPCVKCTNEKQEDK